MNSATDPTANMTEAELADYYYKHRDDADAWEEPEPIGKPRRLDTTISVRFSPGEIALLRKRAAAAGDRVTAYIRRAALEAEEPPLDRGVATTLLSEAERVVERLGDVLHLTRRTDDNEQSTGKPLNPARRSKAAPVTPIGTGSSSKTARKAAATTKINKKAAARQAPSNKLAAKKPAAKTPSTSRSRSRG